MKVASAALKQVGVRHVVVGGLAVGANGYPRATKDVDFLVGDEAFERHAGGLVTLRPGVPFQVNRVAVDFIGAEASEGFLAATLEAEEGPMMERRQIKGGPLGNQRPQGGPPGGSPTLAGLGRARGPFTGGSLVAPPAWPRAR